MREEILCTLWPRRPDVTGIVESFLPHPGCWGVPRLRGGASLWTSEFCTDVALAWSGRLRQHE